MSDASEVKRWFIHYETEPIIISADSIRKDYESLDVVRDPRNKYIEVIAVEDHDRIMADRDELWKRATKFVMPGEMDTGESIEHYIKTLEQTVAELKAQLSMTNSNWPHEKGLHETIARQAKVIEKLREQRNVAHERARTSADEMAQRMREDEQELEAIEREGEGM